MLVDRAASWQIGPLGRSRFVAVALVALVVEREVFQSAGWSAGWKIDQAVLPQLLLLWQATVLDSGLPARVPLPLGVPSLAPSRMVLTQV